MARRRGVAIALAVAALVPVLACETPPRRLAPDPAAAARLRENVDSGLELYEAGDYTIAAQRFREAAGDARNLRALPLERKATTAECTSWLRARNLDALSNCTQRLEALHRRERRADPGLNTLLAMGAVAGNRPIPPFRVPSAVHPMVRDAAKE